MRGRRWLLVDRDALLHLYIAIAAEAGQLRLNIFEPVIPHSHSESITHPEKGLLPAERLQALLRPEVVAGSCQALV